MDPRGGAATVVAVFYPVAALPDWLQPVAGLVPSAYVFEALRALLATGSAPGAGSRSPRCWTSCTWVAGFLLAAAVGSVRRNGLLTRPGYWLDCMYDAMAVLCMGVDRRPARGATGA